MTTRRLVLAAIAIGVLALTLRLVGLDRTTLWYDEVMTANVLAYPAIPLLRERLAAGHSPGFFLLLKLLGIGGDSIVLIRLPAALFGAACAIAGIAAARALHGARAGWMAGLLFAATPVLVDYAQEARPYSAMLLGATLALAGAARILRHPRLAAAAVRVRPRRPPRRGVRELRISWLLLVAGSLWAAAMLPAGLLLWLALDATVVYLLGSRRGGPYRRLARPWAVQRAVCAAALLPLAVALAPTIFARVGDYWFVSPGRSELVRQLGHALLFQFQGAPSDGLGLGGRLALAALVAWLAIRGALALRRRPAMAALAGFACLGPLLVLGLVTLHTPVWLDRYLLVATPAFTLVVAAGLAGAWSSRPGRVAALALAGLTAFQLADLQRGARRADWRPLLETISRASEPPFLVAAHEHQVREIRFEWKRQGRAGAPRFAKYGAEGHPRPDATYLLLREPSLSVGLRGVASGFDRGPWREWLEQRRAGPVDLSSAVAADQQVGAEYRPGAP